MYLCGGLQNNPHLSTRQRIAPLVPAHALPGSWRPSISAAVGRGSGDPSTNGGNARKRRISLVEPGEEQPGRKRNARLVSFWVGFNTAEMASMVIDTCEELFYLGAIQRTHLGQHIFGGCPTAAAWECRAVKSRRSHTALNPHYANEK